MKCYVTSAILAVAGWACAVVAAPSAETVPSTEAAIRAHESALNLFKTMMIKDRIWWPVLREKVYLTKAWPGNLEHFVSQAPEKPESAVVDTFKMVVETMQSRSRVGTQVQTTMHAVRSSVTCAVLKRLSMQGYLLDQFVTKTNDDEDGQLTVSVLRWLDGTLRLSADKLAAVDERMEHVGTMYEHVRELLDPVQGRQATRFQGNELKAISDSMYAQVTTTCASDATIGPYASLVRDFHKTPKAHELQSLDDLLADDQLSHVNDLSALPEIRDFGGTPLSIAETVKPDDFVAIEVQEIEKLLAINRIKTKFLLMNLPIKALALPQWNNVFGLRPRVLVTELPVDSDD